ncbi:stress response protein nst1 isoform X1 [Neodiprion lecontei]|uniref:Stress response protein nst1 isoform X1 n=1 Tax=Neodiprion lecontei TaxID=441921 RepID=A0A6J0BU36_NEOLC|nr:stress response protein nst1 isoform X1 [Neodiprion lecontei]
MGDTKTEISENPESTSGDLERQESAKTETDTKSETLELQNMKEESDDVCNENSSELTRPKTNDDVQRAIEGLKDIPDEELQEFLDDEDFMEGLDVVDAWEGEEEKRHEKRPKSRSRERERRRISRDHNRFRDHRSLNNRERLRREDRKRDENRRDPNKSTKDIERDKMRTQRDCESKIQAEKNKAIKTLLDSDNVVPPGTELEAIETITEKQNVDKVGISRSRRSREKRTRGSPAWRRSDDRTRNSPHRRWSPIIISPERRRSPIKLSPGSRRSPVRLSPSSRRSPHKLSPLILSPERPRSLLRLSPTHPRRPSWERKTSAEERRRSADRHRRRQEVRERDYKPSSRRSRSRERHRSRSPDRHRRKYSRSPGDRRGSPRWRSRSGSRGRSPQRRTRKRSPFINEIRRQFRNESTRQQQQQQQQPPSANLGYLIPPMMSGMPPMGSPIYPHEQEQHPPFMPHHPPGPQGLIMPGPPQGFMNFDPAHPHMAPSINYDPSAPQLMIQSEFSAGPVIYGQHAPAPVQPPLLPLPVPSPQPVPAPGPIMEQGPLMYNQLHHLAPLLPTPGKEQTDLSSRRSVSPQARSVRSNTPRSYRGMRRSTTPYNDVHSSHEERLKTPEPPVISNSKASFGKTSLSSLLEASVSAKDSLGPPVLYPGFKPEILRHCEHALRDLPVEDPRLKMKGRFFFNPQKEDTTSESEERSSNSILLKKGKNKIYWDEEEERHSQITVKSGVHVHQKICQTDEVQTEQKEVQATVITAEFGVQVNLNDLEQPAKEEKRPIMDRLDWDMRETFDYTPKPREADDLRWSLSNSSQKRPWGRAISPPRGPEDRSFSRERTSSDYPNRTLTLCTPARSREEFSSHRGPILRDHFIREPLPPSYRQNLDDHDEHFHDNRSDRSRGESPMVIDDSPEEIEEEPEVFARTTERIVLTKIPRGQSIPVFKGRGGPREGRPFRGGRGSYRDKF